MRGNKNVEEESLKAFLSQSQVKKLLHLPTDVYIKIRFSFFHTQNHYFGAVSN